MANSAQWRVQGNILDSIFLQERLILPFLNLALKFDLNRKYFLDIWTGPDGGGVIYI